MKRERIFIQGIPALVWGAPSEKVYLCVHGKMSSKESAEGQGYQTLSFDLPRHGERKDEEPPCDIWNGVDTLILVADYVFSKWQEVNLFACSLGAFFSLHAYPEYRFCKCLFQSPILDMEYLIGQMMLWFDVSEERLEQERQIDTPIDVLSWKYYRYVKAHPIGMWNHPTAILYAGRDDMQSREVVERFAGRFGCRLHVAENSRHPFMEAEDIPLVENWMRQNI